METQNNLSSDYWQQRYVDGDDPWDIGFASPAITEYIKQLTDKSIKILVPGCGNSYEAAFIFNSGFHNVHVLDYAEKPIDNFKKKHPEFPEANIHCEDFFQHNAKYDLVIEQTFFCALDPSLRRKYTETMFDIINPGGKLAGLLFNCTFEKEGPPFGGSSDEYMSYFNPLFKIVHMREAYNSIPQRAGRELFILLQKQLISR